MIRMILAFLASILTATQAVLISTKGQGICFNDGCEIVEKLTLVPPLYFNVAGFAFFQLVFWTVLWGRNGSEYFNKLSRVLLVAGLAAEAVLVFFQQAIANTFCSYCLIILSVVVFLNLFSGLRQIFRGVVVFCSVLIACYSLDFVGTASSEVTLESGAVATVRGSNEESELYLFFSKSCVYCEKVITSLEQENHCTISFNPVERLDGFSFGDNSLETRSYDPAINIQFMKSLSLLEVPLLLIKQNERFEILRGGNLIQDYIKENCWQNNEVIEEVVETETVEAVETETDYTGTTEIGTSSVQQSIPGIAGQGDQGCSVDEDCPPDQATEQEQKLQN